MRLSGRPSAEASAVGVKEELLRTLLKQRSARAHICAERRKFGKHASVRQNSWPREQADAFMQADDLNARTS
eukprot:879049-Pleurochrysis_carterae.AAC.1